MISKSAAAMFDVEQRRDICKWCRESAFTRKTCNKCGMSEVPPFQHKVTREKLRILCIADTNGTLTQGWYKGESYDICIMLGNHSLGDADKVVKVVPKDKLFGIYGNQDIPVLGEQYIPYFGIQELKYEVINGVRLLGFGGSYKYKDDNGVFWTQEECRSYLEKQPQADVLISHDAPYDEHRAKYANNPAHIGLEGISQYMDRYKGCINIHGHLHLNFKKGREYGVFGIRFIEV